jgi:hypothetical protein
VGGDRFLAFGWLFAFGPLALAIIEFRNKLALSFGIFFILFFIGVNLYTIHPTVYDLETEGAGGSAQEEDFAMAHTIDFSRGETLGYMSDIMAVYEAQNRLGTDATFLLDPVDCDTFGWVIINRAGLVEAGLYSSHTMEIIDRMKSLERDGGRKYNRVYESNNLTVLQQR